MATLAIRDLDEELRARLRVRAAQHGRSMEAEVREILRDALATPPAEDRLGSASGNDSPPSAVSSSSYRHERTSRSHGVVLATRNIEDFLDTGISIVNPWAQP